jgi:hypothetical protein
MVWGLPLVGLLVGAGIHIHHLFWISSTLTLFKHAIDIVRGKV